VLELVEPLTNATTKTVQRFIEMHEFIALGVVNAPAA
jgi:hypothetical protein